MAGVLYSTNSFLKYQIQSIYRGNKHYVWCSEHFDGKAAPRYSAPSLIAPSSNPVEIYRTLKGDVERLDRHSTKINEQKMSFNQRAIDWANNNEITEDQKEEILYLTNQNDFSQWRPLLYVIPVTAAIQGRMRLVPIHQRASVTNEYTIADLDVSEFDIIEF
jgi:hypothetical protein